MQPKGGQDEVGEEARQFNDEGPVLLAAAIYDTTLDAGSVHGGREIREVIAKTRVVKVVVRVEEGRHAEPSAWGS